MEFFDWLCYTLLLFAMQVLQYNGETGTWTTIGKLERGRAYHAVAAANLDAVCPAIGNLNPQKLGNVWPHVSIPSE